MNLLSMHTYSLHPKYLPTSQLQVNLQIGQYICFLLFRLTRIFRVMTQLSPLCPTLYARDSKAVELSPTVGTKQWRYSCQYSMAIQLSVYHVELSATVGTKQWRYSCQYIMSVFKWSENGNVKLICSYSRFMDFISISNVNREKKTTAESLVIV